MNITLVNSPASLTKTMSGTDSPFEGEPVISTHNIRTKPDAAPEVVVYRRWAVCLYVDVDETGNILTAVCIGLPGVASFGQTREEAMANIKEAIECRFEGEDENDVLADLRREFMIPAGSELVYVVA